MGVGSGEIRAFETGATRDSDSGKLDFDGFLSPLAVLAFAQYMHKNRIQSDGSVRDSDNWQKGIPVDQYRKSLFRHFFDAWTLGRGWTAVDEVSGNEVELTEALCGVLFNAFGWLHELLKHQQEEREETDWSKIFAPLMEPMTPNTWEPWVQPTVYPTVHPTIYPTVCPSVYDTGSATAAPLSQFPSTWTCAADAKLPVEPF